MYCTVQDVADYFQELNFGESDPIGKPKVKRLIASAGNMINAKLRLFYDTPIVKTEDKFTLAGIQAKYVAGLIDEIKNPQVSSQYGGTVKVRELKKTALEELDNIIQYRTLVTPPRNIVKFGSGKRKCEATRTIIDRRKHNGWF